MLIELETPLAELTYSCVSSVKNQLIRQLKDTTDFRTIETTLERVRALETIMETIGKSDNVDID